MRIAFAISVLTFITGCAPSSQPPVRTSLPPPCELHIDATANMDLPPQMAAQTGLPPTVKIAVVLNVTSRAVSADPLRSHQSGRLSLVATDASGKLSLASVNVSVDEDQPELPSDGLSSAISHFLDASSLLSQSLAHLGKAQTEPATQPSMGNFKGSLSITGLSVTVPATLPSP